jgi:signal transduction histidine kinase
MGGQTGQVFRIMVAAAMAAPCLYVAVAPAQSSTVKTVLAIHWSTEDFPSTPPLDAAIRETLLSWPDLPLDYFSEYLESDRFPPDVAAESLRDYIIGKYQDRPIDAVIAVSDPALEFALRYRAALFPDAPIVASSVSLLHDRSRTEGAGVTGLVHSLSYDRTLQLALTLHPPTRRVFVIAQAPTVNLLDRIRPELQATAGGVELSFIEEPSLTRLLEAVKAIPPQSLVLYIRYSLEDPGRVLFPNDVARMVSAASPVPVYAASEAMLGSGVVGGLVTSREEIGKQLGEMVRRVLTGTRAADIPVAPVGLVPTFDWRQLQRWGIDPLRLPARSDLRFREATAWDLYRWYIVGALSVVAVQTLLIAGLLVQRQKRQRAEVALRVTSDRNRELAGRLITAQEQERTRIARELHDDVGQRVASLSIALSGVKRKLGDAPVKVNHELAAIQQETMNLSKELRHLSHELHPGALEHLGLVEALKARAEELNLESGVRVQVNVSQGWSDVPDAIAVCLYRVAQEALRNVAKHAAATTVQISLARQNGQVLMRISDDGRGFEPSAAAERNGLGLVSMGERVRMMGGAFEIQASPKAGTMIATTLPTGDDK